MKDDYKVLITLGLFTAAAIPIFPDPYHPPNERPVPFWIWICREINELVKGELGRRLLT